LIAGIDIGIAKPTVICEMNMAGKVEGFLFVEGSPGDVIQALNPDKHKLLAWEEAYHKNNTAITKKMSEFSGGLKQLATFLKFEQYETVRPVDWQTPLKTAFGVKRQAGMKDSQWFDYRMRCYARIVKPLLCPGVQLSHKKYIWYDQVAAVLIAWHVQRHSKIKMTG